MEKVSAIVRQGLPVDLDRDSFYECYRLMAGFDNFIHWVRFNASFKSASLKRL